jgi:hypothetical protein
LSSFFVSFSAIGKRKKKKRKVNIIVTALLKHKQWRKWIGEDTNHGQIIKLPVVVSQPVWICNPHFIK